MKNKSDDRIADSRKLMEQRGVDLLVGLSDGVCSFTATDPIWSLTRYRPLDYTIALIPKGDEAKLLVRTPWEAKMASGYLDKDSIVVSDDLLLGLKSQVASLEFSKAGVVGLGSLPRDYADPISTILGKNSIVDSDDFVQELGKKRYPEEVALAMKASAIAEKGYMHLLEVARPGMPEYELAGEVSSYMRSLGADDNFQLVATSQHNSSVRQPISRLIEEGDIILGEISPGVDGVFIQICRSAMIGEVPSVVEKKYAMLYDSFTAGLKTAKPGVKISQVVKAMNDVLAKQGYEKYCRPPYMRARGHGMGLGSQEPGDLTHDNETVLEDGMMFVLHPNQYIPETGYFLCGDSIVINGDRPTRLTGSELSVYSINPNK